ncbi:uncharacterized protein LOC117124902 [Anneissia japonica]|uniref:uncharacterized protein LOC117124902 n=1 Tax=Anneissia japonica TaxID=1529436 RepID=UPI0014258260|nr:uncharacterized protein LOC117124902 [Anneissia japonica]
MNIVCLQISAIITLSVSLVTVVSLPVGSVSKSNCNSADVFWDKDARACKKCIKCPKGYRRDIECGHGIGGIVQCIPCLSGYYQDKQEFDRTHCSRCATCADAKMKEENECTRTSDAKCGDCLQGFARDPNQPADVGCTSCEYISSHIDCQQTTKQSTTTKHSTPTPSPTSLTQTPTTNPKRTATFMKPFPVVQTSLVPNPNSSVPQKINTDKAKTEYYIFTVHQKIYGKHHVVIRNFYSLFAIILAGFLYIVVKKIMKKAGYEPTLNLCRNCKKGSFEKNENIGNPESGICPHTTKVSAMTGTLDSIPEESSDSDTCGEEVSLLNKRPQLQRSQSAPVGVEINLVRGSVNFTKPKFQNTHTSVTARKSEPTKTPDEELFEKALKACRGQMLCDMSQNMQRQLNIDLNPDRSRSMVQNWKDLALKLVEDSKIVDNFFGKMDSVFEYMFHTQPDTTMETFLNALKGLERPDVLRSVCKSIISGHGKSQTNNLITI